MFLTSRQWILMIDGTLREPFFPRNENRTLIDSHFELYQNDESISILTSLDLEESLQQLKYDKINRNTNDEYVPMIEVDYEYFSSIIWPHIKPSECNYHPSLIFTEIFSFIKGSIESLQNE